MENYLNSFKYLETLKTNTLLTSDFKSFSALEENFNSKAMCEFYGYYMTNLNKTSENEFSKFQKDCEKLGGGIINFGLISAYKEMQAEIIKHYKDFVDFVGSAEGLRLKEDPGRWTAYINGIFSDEKFQKFFLNLNEVFFNVNEVYLKTILQFDEVFFENIALTHDWVHYNLFFVVGISVFFYLTVVYFKSDRPLRLIKSSEKVVCNSILYNIIDL